LLVFITTFHIFLLTRPPMERRNLKTKKPSGKRSQRLLNNFGSPAVIASQL
jgi:hypothetical protein